MSYHPTIGKWIERDPVVYDDGMNLTEYVGSNPLRFTDPSGLLKTEFGKGATHTPPIPGKKGSWLVHYEMKPSIDTLQIVIEYAADKAQVCCDEIAFVQMVRIADITTGKPVIPVPINGHSRMSPPFQDRTTPQGWSIDRGWDEKGQPYTSIFYGTENNGTASSRYTDTNFGRVRSDSGTFHEWARMGDGPKGNFQRPNHRWTFQTYAVCKAGADAPEIYDGLEWGYDTDATGTITVVNPPVPIHLDKARVDFYRAVREWNAQLGNTFWTPPNFYVVAP